MPHRVLPEARRKSGVLQDRRAPSTTERTARSATPLVLGRPGMALASGTFMSLAALMSSGASSVYKDRMYPPRTQVLVERVPSVI